MDTIWHVGETLRGPITPSLYYGDALRVWLSGNEEFYEDAGKLDPCEDGDEIYVWGDKSGNDIDGDRNTSGPIYDEDGLNDLGIAVFTSDQLEFPADLITTGDTELWLFFVANWVGGSPGSDIFYYVQEADPACGFVLERFGGGYKFFCETTGGEKSITPATDTTVMQVLTLHAVEGGTNQMWINGVSVGTVNCGGTTWKKPGWGAARIMGYAGSNISVADFFVVTGSLTDTQRDWGINYQMTRYAIS